MRYGNRVMQKMENEDCGREGSGLREVSVLVLLICKMWIYERDDGLNKSRKFACNTCIFIFTNNYVYDFKTSFNPLDSQTKTQFLLG